MQKIYSHPNKSVHATALHIRLASHEIPDILEKCKFDAKIVESKATNQIMLHTKFEGNCITFIFKFWRFSKKNHFLTPHTKPLDRPFGVEKLSFEHIAWCKSFLMTSSSVEKYQFLLKRTSLMRNFGPKGVKPSNMLQSWFFTNARSSVLFF